MQIRGTFLTGVSKLGSGYNYLKRIAVQAQKKRALLQRKGATADDEAKFRAKNYGIQAANLPLRDFLYQVGREPREVRLQGGRCRRVAGP